MPKIEIYEVEVYVATGAANSETVFVTIEAGNEEEVQEQILKSLNANTEYIRLGSGVFQKTKVLGTCVIKGLSKR